MGDKITDYEPEVRLAYQQMNRERNARQEWAYRDIMRDINWQGLDLRWLELIIPNAHSIVVIDWLAEQPEVERIFISYPPEGIRVGVRVVHSVVGDDLIQFCARASRIFEGGQ